MHKKLVLIAVVVLSVAATAEAQTTVRCESTDGRYRECSIDGMGRVMLTRQLSDTNCIEGKSWGYRDGTVWVNSGCRGEFALTERGFVTRDGKLVVCESQDGARHVCVTDTRGGVAVVRQLSRSSCVQGRTWGFDGDSIWVDEGCRAEFVIGSGRTDFGRPMERLDQLVKCESIDGRTNHCAADTSAGVQLVRQMSDSSCGFGTGWGYDANGVWVANGCRAEFAVRGPMQARATIVTTTPVPATIVTTTSVPVAAEIPLITCQSTNNAREHCRTDTRFGVTLHRQLSDNPCVRDRTWGISPDGIWVTEGCRGQFVLGSSAVVSRPVVQPATLLCESQNNGREHCRTDTRSGITLVRQLSDSPCVRDRTWGVDRDGVWVTSGCRGEFILGHSAPIVTMISSAPSVPTLVCESIDGQRNRCAVDTTLGVRLLRQLSDSDCLLNKTWGIDADGVWVSGGCRAEFAIGEGRVILPRDVPQASRVMCESKDGMRAVCPADTRLGVAVVRQVSDSPCILNSTWGYNSDGIWVTAGCRAEFVLRR